MAEISDEVVRARTGKQWQEWFALLDEAGAADLSHKEIVALLREQHQVAAWWQQSITVAYEKARGLREKYETPDGYQISTSRTMAVDVATAYRAWADRARLAWLPEDRLIITTKNRDKSIRGTWAGGPSRLEVYFDIRPNGKTQISVNHTRLADAGAAAEMKQFWAQALTRLRTQLEGDRQI